MTAARQKTQAERTSFLEREVQDLRAGHEAMLRVQQEQMQQQRETHAAVQAIHTALMAPQPGHTKSLLERVAIVTIKAERGQWGLAVLAAMGSAIIAGSGAVAIMRGWIGGS
jgi:hypothetical protein